ncbi:flagellar hook capping FlgD N-terminal domain-containing protein [Yoonia sp.]|uniref:flagellar hook capping FlgD N-terminal domain-containing protein n=1 Tax=Yoonia sp. TaxID=2212373 RepID=UPI0025E7A7CD|nr:flagellar hook capping FlgD N-terminal domain-containing protein [Yoonia sp.]
MEIGQSPSVGPTSVAPPTQTTSKISSDFETFLRMLTVQMQNQDPLNPVDSSDYAVQLATFSGVEQAVRTNDLLTALTAQMNSSGLAEMAAWVGKEARAVAPAYFDGTPITLSPNPALIADRAEVVVRDRSGAEVQRFDVPVSAEPVEWAGVGPGGYPFSNGMYSFEVISSSNGEVIMQDAVEVYSTVTEVRAQGGQTMLILRGGAAVASSQVSALRDPAA